MPDDPAILDSLGWVSYRLGNMKDALKWLSMAFERLEDAEARGARIYAEVVGHAVNSDAADFVLPLPERQTECIRTALDRAGLGPEEIWKV